MDPAPALSAFGIVFAAVCVWAGILIFNRREKWLIQLAQLVGLLTIAITVASFAVYVIPALYFLLEYYFG